MFLKEHGCTVRDTETGIEQGDLCFDFTGGIVLHDSIRNETWHLGPREIWNAYLNMRQGLTDEDVKEPNHAPKAADPIPNSSSDGGGDTGQ